MRVNVKISCLCTVFRVAALTSMFLSGVGSFAQPLRFGLEEAAPAFRLFT